MDEAVSILTKLSATSFGVVTGLILFGSYYGIWVWGRQYTEMKADYQRRLDKAEAEGVEWKSMAMQGLGLAEHGVRLAEPRSKQGQT